MKLTAFLASAACTLAIATPLAANTWVVDAAGGGDFTDLQTAIDTVAPGDVLLILPVAGLGSYGDALLAKPLDLIGSPGPVRPQVDALDVQAAQRVTLFSLDIDKLRVQGVAGAVVIDACEIGGGSSWPGAADWPPLTFTKFVVEDSADVRLTRSTVEGSEWNAAGRTAMSVRGSSSVQVSSTLLRGADVYADTSFSGWGGDALEVRDTASVWVAASHLIGGHGENFWDLGFVTEAGRGGDAVTVGESAQVDLRGNSTHLLQGGLQDGLGTMGPGPPPVNDGLAVDCTLSTAAGVSVSGVSPQSPLGSCASPLNAPRPFLSLGDPSFFPGPAPSEGPGDSLTAELFGQTGAAAFLIGSLAEAQLTLPMLETTPLWLDLGLMLQFTPVALTGIEQPVSFTWTLPPNPALAGFEYHLQAVELLPSLNLRGTNAGVLVLSF